MKNLPMQQNSVYKQTQLQVSESMGYSGQKKVIRLMSSYEFKAVKLIKQLFKIGRIKSWNSEEVVIPYISSKDGKNHRYYIDFTLETENEIFLIEVKPESKTQKPYLRKGSSEKQIRNFHKAMAEYILNYDKWTATQKYCDEMNAKNTGKKYSFKIWTEKTLNI